MVGENEQQRPLMALVDYIHAREGEYNDGCPLLLLYPFAKSRVLPGSWIHVAIRFLHSHGVIGESFGHYLIFAYDRLKEKVKMF